MHQLGITEMMNLLMECSMYVSQKPQKKRVGRGAPEFDLPKVVLESHLEEGFTIKQIASV